jgi:two-component system CheB/CheR fusion protein
LFFESFEKARRWPHLKIFATDVNPLIIELAAAGQYPESIAAELSPQRIERFFNQQDGLFTVKPELRQAIVFARHNLLTDPPFTRMDLVSCRNTLIYFKGEAQLRALHRLQYATKHEGFLFLGSSESISGITKGFDTINNKEKIFKRTATSLPFLMDTTANDPSNLLTTGHRNPKRNSFKRINEAALIEDSTSLLLSHHAPPAILVNDRHEAVHLFGQIQPYFRAREGTASMELTRILPEHLVPVVTALLFKVLKTNQTLSSDFLRFELADHQQKLIRICVRPVMNEANERMALVVFEEARAELKDSPTYEFDYESETAERINLLQQELIATRESLQSTIEELETSNEELQATNEELMASNEELQSANEELQSINEEMNTVNAEYQEKVLSLNQVNADLDTMAKAVGVATVFVDHELHITRFTPDAVGLFKLREQDIGRPLSDIRHILNEPNLIELFEKTLLTGRSLEREIGCENGHTYLLRILPYQAPSFEKNGAVATLIDVSAIHDRKRLQAIIDALPDHIAVLTADAKIAMVNQAWSRFAKANGDPKMESTGVGANYLQACKIMNSDTDSGKQVQQAYIGIKSVLEGSKSEFSLFYPCHSPAEQRWFVMNVAPIAGSLEFGAVVSHSNVSAWYQAKEGHDEFP